MAERSVFERLVETLPEKERKDLLEKISRSMNFQQSVDEAIYHKPMSTEEREQLIKQDLSRLSLLRRILIWLRSALTGKSRREVLISFKIRSLKSVINRKLPGATGFETRDLTSKVAEPFFRLYSQTLPVKAIFRKLMLKTREVEGAFVRLFEQQVPAAQIHLADLMPIDQMVEVYESSGGEAGLKRELLHRIDEFVGKFDDALFDAVEEQIAPVFYLKDVVLFPFASFFQLFHFTPQGVGTQERPSFKSASAMLALEYLEKMYFAVYTALKVGESYRIAEPVLHYVHHLDDAAPNRAASGAPVEAAADAPDDSDSVEPQESEPDAAEPAGDETQAIEALASSFAELHEEIRRFEKTMPLAELIRYFLRDPYYRLYVYIPKIRLKEYYIAVLKVRCLAELSQLTDQLLVEIVERKIERLFEGQRLVPFENYREYKSVDYEKLGIPLFRYTRSLNLLYNFVRWYYREFVQEVVKILNNTVLVQNRVTRNKLLQHATGIEELEQKIREFELGLSPESVEGKVFHRLRVSLAGDTGHQRMFRTIVLQKDTLAIGFVQKGQEDLAGLQKVFMDAGTNQGEAMRERLEAKYYLNGRLLPLKNQLAERAERIGAFLGLLLQLLKNEGG